VPSLPPPRRLQFVFLAGLLVLAAALASFSAFFSARPTATFGELSSQLDVAVRTAAPRTLLQVNDGDGRGGRGGRRSGGRDDNDIVDDINSNKNEEGGGGRGGRGRRGDQESEVGRGVQLPTLIPPLVGTLGCCSTGCNAKGRSG
jgi:hypothetical protein